tara:strand:- start:1633 stop:2013 length:381 start_codon:yes stop_codon:yes gene_type:complete
MKTFVYGTLKKGKRLHSIIEDSTFIGTHETKQSFDIKDYANGAFPIIFLPKDDGYKIRGEVYDLNSETMSHVWSLETGAGYSPVEIDVGEGTAVAFIYPQFAESSAIDVTDKYIYTDNDIKEWTGA